MVPLDGVNLIALMTRLSRILSNLSRSNRIAALSELHSQTSATRSCSARCRTRAQETFHMGADHGRLEVDVGVAGVEADEVQQVVDELEQPQSVLLEHLGHFLDQGFGGLVGEQRSQALGDAEHDGERRAEFVADVGEEPGLRLVEFAELPVLRFQQSARFLDFHPQAELAETQVFVEIATGKHEHRSGEQEVEIPEQDVTVGHRRGQRHGRDITGEGE